MKPRQHDDVGKLVEAQERILILFEDFNVCVSVSFPNYPDGKYLKAVYHFGMTWNVD
jgi:hypothetical protein